ncbi:carboxyl transferase domain-containing protein [Leptospira wolffii]|uniref:Carboxyl transferase domain-containing protein n=1 Tax=Leptospira wolffii TaxID=409998 RepID=A0ABV5BU77_9LEPT
MKPLKLLIANRGEVSIRIARAAADLGIRTLSVFSQDDSSSKHRYFTDEAFSLSGSGPKAYLNSEEIVKIAVENACDLIHPGYGFLSESSIFSSLCRDAGIRFVGPSSETLEILGDKAKALSMAESIGVPTLPGIRRSVSLDDTKGFFVSEGPMMIKALAGGGGRGIRIVRKSEEIDGAYSSCSNEALSSFGNSNLYVEKFLSKARHLEIQILGDGTGDVVHLWERDCTLQRRNQKILEIAPSPFLPDKIRNRILDSAIQIAKACNYKNLGTFEFLLDADSLDSFYFMECNPRLQVEHTVTEEITGLDLVQLQLQIEMGSSLKDLGLSQSNISLPNGFALQVRLNSEIIVENGEPKASSGEISVFESSSGPGIRVDSAAYSGYRVTPNFDSLLAKLIVRSKSESLKSLFHSAFRALDEFRVEGVPTNKDFLLTLLQRKELEDYSVYTRFVDEHSSELLKSQAKSRIPWQDLSGVKKDISKNAFKIEVPEGAVVFHSSMAGRLLDLFVSDGDPIRKGQKVALLSSMKMEHILNSEYSGYVEKIFSASGQDLGEGEPILLIRPEEGVGEEETENAESDSDAIRSDLSEVLHRLSLNEDEARGQARAKRHKRGQRTIRENISDLCDSGSFTEYGALAIAAQRRRRSLEELIKMSPADGLVAGLGTINGRFFPPQYSRAAVLGYDYTVFMGTQGAMNHKKTDRFLRVVEKEKLPLVFFTEGGGGRPGEVDVPAVAGLDLDTFRQYAGLKGGSPRIAIASGRCFAGNAALFGASDIRIATLDSNIGMGGPVMVKGGGIGNFSAEEIGPSSDQAKNGVIDILAKDEKEAVHLAKKSLSYFQGRISEFLSSDQNLLRKSIPENRLRSYDIRSLIDILSDTDSVLELQKEYAKGMLTAFVRIEGRPLGLIANDSRYLGGAIDADAADKASKFLRLCDSFGLPILFLCDTPGFMVGPEAEKKGLVRKAAEFFEAGASLKVPFFTIVLRKGYGLGAMAMAAGSFHAPVFTVSWPSGEFGAMGIEGEIRTGYQKELSEIKDWNERQKLFESLVKEAYERGKAINMASYLEIDAVIDPSESRKWVLRGLDSVQRNRVG